MWRRAEFQKGAIFAQEEPFGLGEGVVFLPQWISGKAGSVGFVFRKVFNVVDAIAQSAGAFVWGEVADQVSAAAGDRLTPVAGVGFELGFLGRVDFVADDAREHEAPFLFAGLFLACDLVLTLRYRSNCVGYFLM